MTVAGPHTFRTARQTFLKKEGPQPVERLLLEQADVFEVDLSVASKRLCLFAQET